MEGSIVVLIRSFSTFCNVSYTFRTHFVHISYTFRTHFVQISYTFRTHFVHIPYTFRTHVAHMQIWSVFGLYFFFISSILMQFHENHTFLKRGMPPKSRNVDFPEVKAPEGCFLTKGSFWEYTSNELIHFHYDLKKGHFPKKWKLDGNLHIKIIFYRKPKWSVWSIWTYSTGWIFKFVI